MHYNTKNGLKTPWIDGIDKDLWGLMGIDGDDGIDGIDGD